MKTRNGFATVCLLAMTLTATSQAPDYKEFTITSCTSSEDGTLMGLVSADKEHADFHAVYVDASGDKIWERTYGGNGVDELTALCTTSDGGFILGGRSNSGISGQKSHLPKGEYDFWVVKINSKGDVEWDQTYGGYEKDNLVAIEELPDGVIVLAGYSDSKKRLFENGDYDFLVVWTDKYGNLLKQERYGHKGKDILTAFTQLSDRSLLLGGYTRAKSGFEFNVVKIDRHGNFTWERNFGDATGEYMAGITGFESLNNGGFTLIGQNETESWRMNFDADGNKIHEENSAGNMIAKAGL